MNSARRRTSASSVPQQIARVRAACEEIGRDPGKLVYSNALTVCCGSEDKELERRAEAIGEAVDDLRRDGLAGTPQEVVDRIGEFASLGSQRIYLQCLDVHDLDHLRLLAAEVMPHV
jgi:alkanesulfonate monooxygenase SsuD/methylene tetrahydromethanopterin reductase-like flavin-dependent oxidoreductase (luciferase family)